MIPHETLVVHELPRWIVRKSPYSPHKLAPAPPRWVFGIEQFGLRGVRILTTHTRHTTRSYQWRFLFPLYWLHWLQFLLRFKLFLQWLYCQLWMRQPHISARPMIGLSIRIRYIWISVLSMVIRTEWQAWCRGSNPPLSFAYSGDRHRTRGEPHGYP